MAPRLVLNPDYAEPNSNLANLLSEQGEYERASNGDFDAFSLNGIACTSGGGDKWLCTDVLVYPITASLNSTQVTLDVTQVTPEPGELAVLGVALAGLVAVHRRRRRQLSA